MESKTKGARSAVARGSAEIEKFIAAARSATRGKPKIDLFTGARQRRSLKCRVCTRRLVDSRRGGAREEGQEAPVALQHGAVCQDAG
jgi:hypothetical protein